MLEDLLGRGYFGKVYKCEDELHGSVAAKIMSQKPAESPEDWEIRKNALLSEARHLKRANDLNVVPVHYVVYKNGTNVAVEGEELDQISTHGDDEENLADMHLTGDETLLWRITTTICENGPSNLDFVRKVATQVTLGLQALHNKEMLHRDIKPGNILIDGRWFGKTCRLRASDRRDSIWLCRSSWLPRSLSFLKFMQERAPV